LFEVGIRLLRFVVLVEQDLKVWDRQQFPCLLQNQIVVVGNRNHSNGLYAAHHLNSYRYRILGNEKQRLRLLVVDALLVLVEHTQVVKL
jgi:hypothetical protein